MEQQPFELSKLSLRAEAEVPSKPTANLATLPADIDDVPDGGYGWVIVAACSMITFVPRL